MSSFKNLLRNMALPRKLLLISILTICIAMAAALLALIAYDSVGVRPRLVADLSSRIELLSVNLDVELNFNDRSAAANTLKTLRKSPEIKSACLFDAARQAFATYAREGSKQCAWPDEAPSQGIAFRDGTLTMLSPVRFHNEIAGYLLVEEALPSLSTRLRQYGLVLAVVLLALFTGALLHAFSLKRLVTRPVYNLASIADRVSHEQRYDLRAQEDSGDEIGRLAKAFNSMLSAIADRDSALHRSQHLLRNIVEMAPAKIYVKDLESRYLLVNERLRRDLPPGAPEPVGRRVSEFFPPEVSQPFIDHDHRVIESGQACTYEEDAPDHHGEMRTFLSVKFPLLDENGELWALGGVSTDITDRKKAELELIEYRDRLEHLVETRTLELTLANQELARSLETLHHAQDELVRSEKLAALGALVAGVAHELNTPIGNSLLAVSSLLDFTRTFEEHANGKLTRPMLNAFVKDIKNGCEIILRNLHRADDLVIGFKQVAVDRETTQRRQFDLADMAGQVLLTLSPSLKKHNIRIHVDIPEKIVMDSYPGPFGQIIANLFNNAVIHAFDQQNEGDIWLTACMLDGSHVALSIRDNGAGIAPDHLTRIYDPFFTTKFGKGGSGLGLNIVYNIVHGILGGRIKVESQLGGGTCFTFELPLQAQS